jgi:hypothetical protein
VFISGTVSKLIGSDSFELANVNVSPHAGNGARLLTGFSLLVQHDPALTAGLKPGVRLSLAVDIAYREKDTIYTITRKIFWSGRPPITPVAASP